VGPTFFKCFLLTNQRNLNTPKDVANLCTGLDRTRLVDVADRTQHKDDNASCVDRNKLKLYMLHGPSLAQQESTTTISSIHSADCLKATKSRNTIA